MSDKLNMLREAIELLSWPYEKQIEWLTIDGHFDFLAGERPITDDICVDELVLYFEDSAILADGLLGTSEISEFQASLVKSLLKLIVDINNSTDGTAWTLGSLKDSLTWANIRDAACECLRSLGERGSR